LKPASIEVIQPEEPISEPGIINTISSGLKNLLGSSVKEEPKKAADNVSASEKKSKIKFMPKSPLAIFSAQKLVSCKIVPEKMEAIHKRLLKIKDVNIAESKLRDKTNDKLMPVIHFDFDQIKIKPAYIKLLRQQSSCVMKALKSRNDMIIQIEGHADERGSDEYNMALGHRRANIVANAIKAYLPDSSLARIFSFGEEFPLIRLSNKSAWGKNRRVEFTLLLKP
ncbi:MAG: OmpA family protein, partial [SAR324 cluster bacterium]|nr:OmpA family protein [SAR324 cluster bacterium]